MIAEATLIKGRTYRIRGKLFTHGKTVPISDSDLVAALQVNPAFTVYVPPAPAKVVRKLVKPVVRKKKAAKKKTKKVTRRK